MSEQNYENYWSITNAFTNYHGKKFIKTLNICVSFIDKFSTEKYTEKKYSRLQSKANFDNINLISVRKRINQLVKLGFINPFLTSYPSDTLKYLEANTKRRRNSILSKIIYTNSKLNASVKDDSKLHQINFLLKTLEEIGNLHKNDVIGLMTVDISTIQKDYLTLSELDKVRESAQKINFEDRKYNQVSHFWNLLKKLDDLAIVNDILYFEEDAKIIFGEDLKQETKKRDGYLHRIYKNQLQEESDEELGQTKCMLEKLSYPSLVASHIKPFIKSNDDEAYDPNNGLLLSRNMDILFDQGYISFEDNGKIIYSNKLTDDVKEHLDNYSLDSMFINEKRIKYFRYHRKNVFKKSA